jgi:hypothetical protein
MIGCGLNHLNSHAVGIAASPVAFGLAGLLLRSPHQTVFPPLIMTVPNTTGIARPSSAVGTEKSPSADGCGPLGCGASSAPTTVVATKYSRRSQKKISPLSLNGFDIAAEIYGVVSAAGVSALRALAGEQEPWS